MLATFVTLAVIGFAVGGLRDLARRDGAKVKAALQGRSWTAQPRYERPILVRFNSSRRAEASAWRPALRAAA